MSATATSRRATPSVAVRIEVAGFAIAASPSLGPHRVTPIRLAPRRAGRRCCARRCRRNARRESGAPRGGRRPAACRKNRNRSRAWSRPNRTSVFAEHDAVGIDAAVLAGPGAALQAAVVDQAGDEFDRAEFGRERGVEADLVDAVDDVGASRRHLGALQRIDLDDQHVLGAGRMESGKIGGLAEIAAVPIGHPVDHHRLEQQRQAGRRHHRVGGDLLAREDLEASGPDIGRGDEELQLVERRTASKSTNRSITSSRD